jgi:integrase
MPEHALTKIDLADGYIGAGDDYIGGVPDVTIGLTIAGQQANHYAAANVFADYRSRIAANTLRRQDGDLRLFEQYLLLAGVNHCPPGALAVDAQCWRGMTWGLVAGFREWMLTLGYAVGSVNVRLATIKRYCELAHQAGSISASDYTGIKTVKGYGHKQAKKVDEKRDVTRTGDKKAAAVTLTKAQADALKRQPDTPQGRRDALLMCLLLDHGLRCGEVAGLPVTAFDLRAGMFTFDRPKVGKVQTHKMTADTIRAAAAYISQDGPAGGALLLGSRKGGQLGGAMSERAINARVGVLGQRIGVPCLSPHDCRHYWATRAARQGTDPFALQEAGGWNSLAMPRRYVEAAQIANEGVKL